MRDADRKSICEEIVELAGKLAEVPAAIGRLSEWAGRGFPAGGDGDRRGNGGSPTESAAVFRDAHGAEITLIDNMLRQARRALREIDYAVARSRPLPVTTGEVWCRNHLTHLGAKAREPIYRKDLCRFCWDFQRAENRVPTRAILDARASGRRITQQLVDRELGRTG